MSTNMKNTPIPREAVEDLIVESEKDHRFAHALLLPRNLYYLWSQEESKKLAGVLKIEFTKPGIRDLDTGIAPKAVKGVAKFIMVKLDKSKPALFYYKLFSVST